MSTHLSGTLVFEALLRGGSRIEPVFARHVVDAADCLDIMEEFVGSAVSGRGSVVSLVGGS